MPAAENLTSLYLLPTIMSNTKKDIIPHLGGIRGCAILLILLFHLGITGDSSPLSLPGGYLGVEIFLVMSGFLLALGLSRKTEGVLDFARKKLLRIMYPVSVTLLLTMLVCLFCMDYADLLITARNALWSAFAANNIQLAESGAEYFSDDSTWNPLLHTWYVAITVQIYILFYAGWRFMARWNKWLRCGILLAIALFSFFYGQCHEWRLELVKLLGLPVWIGNPDSMYYSTLGRLWEPLAGAAVLLLPVCHKQWLNAVISTLALVAIGVCVWLVPPQAMLYVVLATVLLLRYGADNVIACLYNNKLTRGIGAVSFSLYLVHMPIIVCHKCFTFTRLDWWNVGLILAGSMIAAVIFWFFIEKRKVSLITLAAVWGTSLAAAVGLYCTEGLKKHWNAESNKLELPVYENLREERDSNFYKEFNKEKIWHYTGWISQTQMKADRKKPCYLHRIGTKQKKPTFVVMGDSHAGHYITGLDTMGRKHMVAGLSLTTVVVPFWNRTILETSNEYYCNKEKIDAIWHWLKNHPELTHVIIGQTWLRAGFLNLDWEQKKVPARAKSNLPMLKEFCLQLKKIGKKPIIIGPEPRFDERTPLRYFRYLKRNNLSSREKLHPKCTCTEEQFYKQFSDTIKFMEQMEKDKVCYVIYPHKYLFKKGVAVMEENGKIVFRDNHHFSVNGSEIICMRMWTQLSKALNYEPSALNNQ